MPDESVFTAGDLSNLREKSHNSIVYVSVFKPATLLTARVNDAGAAHGDRTIVYDTGVGPNFSLIENGQTLWVGTAAGLHDKGKVRIKDIAGAAAAGSTIVAENSINWGNNDYLTFLHNYELWPIFPSFDPATGIFTKDIGTGATGVTYTDENTQPPPVCLAGPHRAKEYKTSNIVFDIDLSDSYAIADGATISSYAASIAPAAAGATVTINGGTGVGDVTATQKGQWIVKYTVTDSNAKTQVTYRTYNTNAPLLDLDNLALNGAWPKGYKFSFSLHASANTLADMPDGTICVLWYDSTIGGVANTFVEIWGNNFKGHITYGYLRRDRISTDFIEAGDVVNFEVSTIEALLDAKTEYGSIDLEAVAASTKWYQYASWMTVGRAIHHALKWHSTIFEVADVLGLMDNTVGVHFAEMNESSLYQRASSLASKKGIFANLCCDRMGRLHLSEDSQMQSDATRAAMDVLFSVSTVDIGNEIPMPRHQEKRVILAYLDGFAFDATTLVDTPLLSLSPGTVPNPEGTTKTKDSGQVLTNQAEANEKAGRVLAVSNKEFDEWSMQFSGNYLGVVEIIPSLGLYKWFIADALIARDLPLLDSKLICRSVSHRFPEDGDIQTVATFEPVVISEDGQTDTYPSAPGCKPGQGSTAGVSDPTPGDEDAEEAEIPPTVLTVFSATSVDKRQVGVDTDWVNITTDANIEGGDFDPYWPQQAQSYDPGGIQYDLVGSGLLKEATGLEETPVDALPASPPPDTWSDATPPTVNNVDFIAEQYDDFVEDDRYFLISYFTLGNYRAWLLKRSGAVDSYLPLFNGALPTQVKAIWMAVTSEHVITTSWHDLATDKLKLHSFTKSPFAFDAEFDLGTTSEAELDAYTKWAIPVSTSEVDALSPSSTAPFHVAGRMVNPVSLPADTYYILKYTGSWSEIAVFDEGDVAFDLGTSYVAALTISAADADGTRDYRAAVVEPI